MLGGKMTHSLPYPSNTTRLCLALREGTAFGIASYRFRDNQELLCKQMGESATV